MVVSWVLSPNSAMKKAAATVPTIPKRLGLGFSSFAFSGLRVHRPKAMNEREAASEMISMGTTAVMTWPMTTMIAKLAIVARKIPKRTL